MTSSSADDNETLFATIQIAARKSLNAEITTFERLKKGGNNQVYKLTGQDGRLFAAKVYYTSENDMRDRLDAETRAFAFLREQGLASVPQVLLVDRDARFAIFEFIEGSAIEGGHATEDQIKECASFLKNLKDLSTRPEAISLPAASEACYSFDMAEKIVKSRLARFDDFAASDLMDEAMLQFLENDFKPAIKKASEAGAAILRAAGLAASSEIDVSRRTLSPSDFGFHNALIRPDGRLAFLDFEYFGWDEPVKMISDFLLHPAMSLNQNQRRAFMKTITPSFNTDAGFKARFKAGYPIFVLKWCLIMLNEFLPQEMSRRKFAKSGGYDSSVARRDQLSKARAMLERVNDDYEIISASRAD